MPSFPEDLSGLLESAACFHTVRSVELVETHISWVLLTGEYAYKIKRPVCFPFLDMRDAGRRLELCHEELRLNRRFAAELYLDVCPIVRRSGKARMGGEALAAIHESLPQAAAGSPWGGVDTVKATIASNAAQAIDIESQRYGTRRIASLYPEVLARLAALEPWMRERLMSGHVRECHGDLHCGNVVRWDGALSPRHPALIVMMGLSGSGKTRLAACLAPLLGAIHLTTCTHIWPATRARCCGPAGASSSTRLSPLASDAR